MSLNDRARIRSRWPAVFDIEGIPRDNKIRTEKLQLEANMQISKVAPSGTFDFNNPPPQRYEHQEFPRAVYRGTQIRAAHSAEEQEEALEHGWFLTKAEALEDVPTPVRAKKGKLLEIATSGDPDTEQEEYDAALLAAAKTESVKVAKKKAAAEPVVIAGFDLALRSEPSAKKAAAKRKKK